MRLTILTQYYPPEVGAPQTRLSAIARELTRRGHSIQVVTAMPNYPSGRVFDSYRRRLFHSETTDGIAIHRSFIYAATGTGLNRIANYLSFSVSSILSSIFRNLGDVLFVESPPLFLGGSAVILKFIKKIPIIFNVADLWPDSIQELGVIQNRTILRVLYGLERKIYSEAFLINAVTEGIYDRITGEKGVDPAKVTFFPNGVDTDIFHPENPDPSFRQRLGLDERPLFVYPGTMGVAQGLDVAVRAAKMLEESGTDVTVLLLGAGSDRRRLEAMVADMKIGNVRFMDPVSPETVNQILALSVGGIVTLRKIPLLDGARPSKMFPIMAAAKPVIFSGNGEGARLVREAGCGLVCAAENEVELASAIRWCLDNITSVNEMGKSGANFVENNFKWSALIGPWIERVESLVNKC